MQYYPFDSRRCIYRSDIGAVASKQSFKLRILLHRDAHCHDAFLLLKRDGGEPREIKLNAAEMLEDYRFYDTEISLEEGLYWYSFRYTSEYGDYFITKSESSRGVVSQQEGDWWQQTVYDADYATPEWLRGGIIYQIFPDRFCRSGKKHEGVPEDRFICSLWSRVPAYRVGTEGCTLGNDYYGGDLEGITEKLPYLSSLGVSCIYLNPIFEAHSNHRYNTADYMKVDPMLGNEQDLQRLCKEAERYGISVILDGVFSHTGDDSVYFDRCGRYQSGGAYHSQSSPYFGWYHFENFPYKYKSWWGIDTLPETDEENASFREFITGENGVLRKWLRSGIRGWRLDVADELPDSFLDALRKAVKTERADAYILGEVWEDASNKVSYGSRRRFLRGKQLDSVMNYPFSGAIINFLRGESAEMLNEVVCTILENYPKCAVDLLMNHIGTHDTARAITVLAKGYPETADREWMASQVLSLEEYERGRALLRLASVLQYTLPGVPSVYYGDEVGMQGYGDPFCRAAYPWGQEDNELLSHYRKLGEIRKQTDAFRSGEYCPQLVNDDRLVFERRGDKDSALILVNRTSEPFEYALPKGYEKSKAMNSHINGSNITVGGFDFDILIKKHK